MNRILKRIQELADNHGIYVSYVLVNQNREGNKELVKEGIINTCTVYVDIVEGEELDELIRASCDTVEEALAHGIKEAEKYLKSL